MKKKKVRVWTLVIIAVVLIFMSIEARPYKIHQSTVFTSGDTAEIRISVAANTFFPYDKEEFAQKVVEEYEKINGKRKNVSYEIEIYRFWTGK